MSFPNTDTLPDVILTKDDIIPITVDLPAPFGPKNAKKSPFLIDRFMFSRALKPFRYILFNLTISTAFFIIKP